MWRSSLHLSRLLAVRLFKGAMLVVFLMYPACNAAADPVLFDKDPSDSSPSRFDAAPADPLVDLASRLKSKKDDVDSSHDDQNGSRKPISGGPLDDGTGTAFIKQDFMDTDFSRTSFRDSFKTEIDNVMKLTPLDLSSDALKRLRACDDRILAAPNDLGMMDGPDTGSFQDDRDTWNELLAPTPTGDWVPGDLDRLNNGGFGTAKDNGRPVPYRLNGHVNIQRGVPWETSGE